MSVLIVDDEESRVPLVAMLRSLGHREILEAPDWLQATKLIDATRSRFRLVVASQQANGLGLLSELRARAAFDPCAFVLTTSERGSAETCELKRTWAAREALLEKPFSRKDLAAAIHSARASRNFTRNAILCLTGTGVVDAVSRSLVDAWPAHWSEAVHAPTAALAESHARRLGWKMGAVLIDPQAVSEREARWLRRFGVSVLAQGCVFATLGNRGAEILPFREICDRFFAFKASESRLELWHEALSNLSARCLSGWELHDGIQRGREALRDGNQRLARATVARLIEIDASHSETRCLQAEVAARDGREAEGVRIALEAAADDPCSPRLYLFLLRSIPAGNRSLREQVARDAQTYCPNHPQVASLAAETLASLAAWAESVAPALERAA